MGTRTLFPALITRSLPDLMSASIVLSENPVLSAASFRVNAVRTIWISVLVFFSYDLFIDPLCYAKMFK